MPHCHTQRTAASCAPLFLRIASSIDARTPERQMADCKNGLAGGFGRHYQVLGAQLDTDSFSLSFPLKISLSIPPSWLHETAADKHACILCMQNKVLAHKLWNHPLHVSAFAATHPDGPTRDSSCIASPAMDLAACRDACHSERCPNMATIGAIPFLPLAFGSPTRCVWTVYFRGCAKAICTIPNSNSLHSPTIASLSRPMAVVSSSMSDFGSVGPIRGSLHCRNLC
jgi:hypothetical protein